MKIWCHLLLPVLQKFVESRSGKPEIGWWLQICNHIGGGSGPSYLSGWITVFSVFDNKKRWRGDDTKIRRFKEIVSKWPIIDTDDLNVGLVSCPVVINETETTFIASVCDVEVSDGTIKPLSCWDIFEKPPDLTPDENPNIVPTKDGPFSTGEGSCACG